MRAGPIEAAQVYAALAYYSDRREEIDRTIRADDQFADDLRRRTESKLPSKSDDCGDGADH